MRNDVVKLFPVAVLLRKVLNTAWISDHSAMPTATTDSLWAAWSDAEQADTSSLKTMYEFSSDGYWQSQADSAYSLALLAFEFNDKETFGKRSSGNRKCPTAIN